MAKANLRLGMDEFFPTQHYIDIMNKLINSKTPLPFSRVVPSAGFGVKLKRMKEHGLIVQPEKGMYEITPYGRKIMNAVDAYKKEMMK